MKKTIFKLTLTLILFIISSGMAFSASNDSLLVQGLEAYKAKDWDTALFFLRKASTLSENANQETWYILVMAESFAKDYDSVLTDGAYFVQKFPKSSYIPQIEYQIARANLLKENFSEAEQQFNTFCKKHPNHELYPQSLFWQAECLYQTFNFQAATILFEKLVNAYPESPKATEALFRLELLAQREREEKLLYLLRVTGEENLIAREEFERQIKQYQSEESINIRLKILELNGEIDRLRIELEDSNKKNEVLSNRLEELSSLNEILKSANQDTIKAATSAALELENQKRELEQALLLQQAKEYSNTTEPQPIQTQPTVEPEKETETDAESDYELAQLKLKAKELQRLINQGELQNDQQ